MTTKVKKYIPADKPITIYFYGNGKGKTTAALGVALRATGHNLKCLILQAIKGTYPSGERQSIGKYFDKSPLSSRGPKGRGDLMRSDRDCPPERLESSSRAGRGVPRNDNNDYPAISIRTVGRGFVGIGGDKLSINEHRQAARAALSIAGDEIASGAWDVVVLDEYSDLVSLRLIDVEKLLAVIRKKRTKTDIIITGHKPLQGLIKLSDIVTEMKKVKHHFVRGIIAKKGIDF